ncbi:anthocyanin 5-aromatic acyltransferase-like [Typha latifolia]|uniref:anthocyanin 5-aromatic acyltransferase-like n=1 Tax=Typha latifolia TaxID=4733 RepID=UPI003C2D0679
MSEVRIVKTTHVPLLQLPAPPLDLIKLSSFDAPWVGLPPIQRLLLFTASDHLPPFPSLLESLKSSLSATLIRYFALAGKLTYLEETADVAIDCSPAGVGAGVAFAEAEADGDAGRLAAGEEHDVEAFVRLVPEMTATNLPAPVMAVQATRFTGGGVAVGIAMHHALADGRALWRFMEAWTKCCRGEVDEEGRREKPSFDRAVIRHPNGEEVARELVRMVAPDLPRVISNVHSRGRFKLARRTFTLDSQRIQLLKQRILQLGATHKPSPASPPSRFVSIAAQAWTAFVRSKSMNPTDDTYLFFLADCRTRLEPPVEEGYFGNCVKWCLVSAIAGDLYGEDGIFSAASAIQKTVREALENPLERCHNWMERIFQLPLNRLANVAASPQFKVYETDFGWGKPDRVELVSMNHDGEIALAASKDEGGVQVSVSLNPMHMEGFKSHFLNF